MVNSFHKLFAYKASGTFGFSEPGNTNIKIKTFYDLNLTIEATDKIWVVILLNTANGQGERFQADMSFFQVEVVQTEVLPNFVLFLANFLSQGCVKQQY